MELSKERINEEMNEARRNKDHSIIGIGIGFGLGIAFTVFGLKIIKFAGNLQSLSNDPSTNSAIFSLGVFLLIIGVLSSIVHVFYDSKYKKYKEML